MIEYKSLYYQLFNKLTDIIEEMKEIQRHTEEKIININDNTGVDESK